MPDDQIDAVDEPDRWTDVFDERERAVLELTDVLSGPSSNAVPSDLAETLRAEFDEVQRAELILVIGQANFNNRAGNAAKQLLG